MKNSLIVLVVLALSGVTLAGASAEARSAKKARAAHARTAEHHRSHHWSAMNRPHGRGMPITAGSSEVRINAVGEVIGPTPGK